MIMDDIKNDGDMESLDRCNDDKLTKLEMNSCNKTRHKKSKKEFLNLPLVTVVLLISNSIVEINV